MDITSTPSHITTAPVSAPRAHSGTAGSNFSVNTPLDEFLPQSRNRVTDEKHFENIKDYIAYLLLLLEKMDKVKPPEGQKFVRLEDKPIFQKLAHELEILTTQS